MVGIYNVNKVQHIHMYVSKYSIYTILYTTFICAVQYIYNTVYYIYMYSTVYIQYCILHLYVQHSTRKLTTCTTVCAVPSISQLLEVAQSSEQE